MSRNLLPGQRNVWLFMRMSTEPVTTPAAPLSSALLAVRAAQNHHLMLTAMADQKASLLLVGALLTLPLSLGPALHDSRPIAYPFMALAVTALLVAILTLRALTPRLLILTRDDESPEVNLLFCGHFSEIPENEYVQKLREQLGSEDAAFDALARDLYQMGLVLHQTKLRALALALVAAVAGLIATLVGFAFAIFAH